MQEVCGVCGENNVIYIQKKVCGRGPSFEYEEGGVTLGNREPNRGNELCEAMKPSAGCLFEAIKRFM
jgi:hypothetical protein